MLPALFDFVFLLPTGTASLTIDMFTVESQAIGEDGLVAFAYTFAPYPGIPSNRDASYGIVTMDGVG